MQIQSLIYLHYWQKFFIFLTRPDSIETLKFEIRARSPKDILLSDNVNPDGIKDCRRHKACNEATPDQIVQLELISRQVGFHGLRSQRYIRGTDCLMCILCCRLRLTRTSLTDIGLAKSFSNVSFYLSLCLIRDTGRVGTHIGNQTLMAACSQFNTFVELLGQTHGFLGLKVEPNRGILLHGTRRIRQSWLTALFACIIFQYRICRIL